MPSWILPSLIVAYGAILTLLILASAFSYEEERRDAAFRVLRIMLPWGIVALLIDMKLHEHDPARYFAAIAAGTADQPANPPARRQQRRRLRTGSRA